MTTGGDQGRDFETFRTYLQESPLANSAFIGRISDGPVAFACSLQKTFGTKIKGDVATIMSSGVKVCAIHFFTARDVPVSDRHVLQEWAQTQHGVHLDIYDGQAIAELLIDRDVVWIAERYLGVPSQMLPVPPVTEEDSWYEEYRQKWRLTAPRVHSYADFGEIRAAVRHATFDKTLVQDIPFWLQHLEVYIEQDQSPLLKRRAIYEHTVASLRGLGSLLGHESRLRAYFGVIGELGDAVDLGDAAILLNYCIGAAFENRIQFSPNELAAWRAELIARVEHLLDHALTPGSRCPLLELRGYLAMSVDPATPSPPEVDAAMTWWKVLADEVEQAPLFPLEQFSDRLLQYLDLIGDHEGYDKLVSQIEELLANRVGAATIAEKCRDRALAYFKRGQILRAMGQLHKAKVEWFTDETFVESVMAMLQISRWYSELRLPLAAKYYSMSAARLLAGSRHTKSQALMPKALFMCAGCDYHMGAWVRFFDWVDLAVRAEQLFSKKQDQDGWEMAVYHGTIIRLLAESADAELAKYVHQRLGRLGLVDETEELLAEMREKWATEPEGLWSLTQGQLSGPPFSDIGKRREYLWASLGVNWRVVCDNAYDVIPRAEQFVALLQIVAADLAGTDLCLLPTEVKIDLSVGTGEKLDIISVDSNKFVGWKVTLPKAPGAVVRDLVLEHLAVATHILWNVSLLPVDRLERIVSNQFEEGLSSKVFVGRPYDELYREFITVDDFGETAALSKGWLGSKGDFKSESHPDLGWVSGPGPGYSAEDSLERIRTRYARSVVPIRFTIRRLRKSRKFLETVTALRDEGWLDWHILGAICTAAVNYRFQSRFGTGFLGQHDVEEFSRILSTPEPKHAPEIPESLFTTDHLRLMIKANQGSTLQGLGLHCKQRTPDLESINQFLRARYNYWTDDVDHEDPFKR